MNTNILKASIAAASMLAVFAGLAWAQEQSVIRGKNQAPTRYTVTDLGVVGQSLASPGQPFVLTDNGLVSGEVVLPSGPSHALIYFKGSMKDIGIPALGGPNSAAFGVNIGVRSWARLTLPLWIPMVKTFAAPYHSAFLPMAPPACLFYGKTA